MKRFLHSICFLLTCGLVISFITGCHLRRIGDGYPTMELVLMPSSLPEKGQWTAQGKRLDTKKYGNNHWIPVRVVEGKTHIYLASIESSDLFPLWETSDTETLPVVFHQPAGSIEFSKDAAETKHGSFTIEPNATFQQLVEELSGKSLTTHQLLMCIIQKTEAQTLRDYAETGISLEGDQLWDWIRYQVSGDEVLTLKSHLPHVSAADVITLKRYGVKPDFVAKLSPKFPDFDAEDYTTIRRYGVSDSFALEVAESGISFSSDDLVNLRRYGVPSDWPVACAPLDKIHGVDDMVSMRRYGVSLDFLKAAHDHTAVQSAEDIVNLRRRGISAQFLNDLSDTPNPLSVDQIIQLRNAGVTADFHNAVQAAGKYSVEDVIQFRRRGVGIELIKAANTPDREPLSVDTIIELRNRGLSPKSVRELRQ